VVTLVDLENAVAVAVDGGGQTVRQNVFFQQPHVTERRFGIDKAQRHQFAGRVVDEHQQAAARRASLEPVVRGTVDLDQFPAPSTPLAHRVGARTRPPSCLPQARAQHGLTHRFHRQLDLVDFLQLLACQRRPEVGVVRANQAHRLLQHLSRRTPVRRFATLPAQQTLGSLVQHPPLQPLDLPDADAQPSRGACLIQLPLQHLRHHLATQHILGRHHDHYPILPWEIS
jgi:hypothetical protein